MKGSALFLFLFFTSVAIAGPRVTGDGAGSLSRQDVETILSLTDARGLVWLLEVRKTFFLSEPNLVVEAYLDADTHSGSLRRGQLLKFDQVADGSDYTWTGFGGTFQWAQVDDPRAAPDGPDRPFQVTGKLSDEEVLGIVEFIRGSPHTPSRAAEAEDGSTTFTVGMSADGTIPISEIEEKADCFFEVRTERRPGAGQLIQVRRGDTGWELVEVAEWVV